MTHPMQWSAEHLTPSLWRTLQHVYDQDRFCPVRVSRTNDEGCVAGTAANRLSDLGLVEPVMNSNGYGRWAVRLTYQGRTLVEEGLPPGTRATRTLVARGRLVWGIDDFWEAS